MTLAGSLVRAIDVITPDLIELRRDLHAFPELSWGEERTTDVIARWMDKASISYERLHGTGLVAEVGPSEGPMVALRADLDALPVPELSDDPWRSTVTGVAHACGHDVHTAGLIGAALALSAVHAERRLPVRVRLLFQPAEEQMPGGAVKLIQDGFLKGVSRIFALHCDPSLDVGEVGLREGSITSAADRLHVRLAGRGGHTSRPHLTQDLTYALGTLITQLPGAMSRRFDPRAAVCLVWGQVSAGEAANVIPSSGELNGTIRMVDLGAWHSAEEIVRELVTDILRPYGVESDVVYVRGVPPVVNEFEATEALRRAVTEAVGATGVATAGQSFGGEDFGWYLESVPGAMGRLGTRSPGGQTYDLHQGDFRVDERCVAVAAKVLALAAVA